MPALPSFIIAPLGDQVAVLLPAPEDTHPLGGHRRRIPDRLLFDTLADLGSLPAAMTVRLDRGYDVGVTCEHLAARGPVGEIAATGKFARIAASNRWPEERTNAHTKLLWCPERRAVVVAFWLAFLAIVIMVRRLICEAGSAPAGLADPRREQPAYWPKLSAPCGDQCTT